jgi:hypothetical protein
MIKKALLAVAGVLVVIVAAGVIMYARNAAPVAPPITSADAANPNRPYVVKLHAKWCPICMVTKTVWSDIDAAYSGRVNLVVFDFTNQATTEASRAEAARLGLEKYFDENAGQTGTVSILDGRTKQERTSIHGSREFGEYRAAINASLHSN